MSVIVKGMELPIMCSYCKLTYYGQGDNYACCYCSITDKEIDYIARHPDCPLVEVEDTDDGWIPCEDRLPEDDTEVFVYLFDRQSPYIAWLTDCHWYTEDFEVDKENEPLAWMPLPPAYEPKEDTQ